MIDTAFGYKIITEYYHSEENLLKLTYKFAENISKIFLSTVLLQLMGIVLGAESGAFSPYTVLLMLEHSAASAVVALGGHLLMEYIIKNDIN